MFFFVRRGGQGLCVCLWLNTIKQQCVVFTVNGKIYFFGVIECKMLFAPNGDERWKR